MRLLIFLLSLALGACSYREMKSPADGTSASGPVTFEKARGEVFARSCERCHNSGTLNFLDPDSSRKMADRIYDRALVRADMPPGAPLSPTEKSYVEAWLRTERPDLKVGTDVGQAEKAPTWKDAQAVFKTYCVECHSAPAPEGGLDLTSRTDTQAKASRIFARVVIDKDMPLPPLPAPSASEKKLLVAWMLAGFP